ALLYRAHKEDQLLAGAMAGGYLHYTVRDHANAAALDVEQIVYLIGCKLRDGDDEIRTLRREPRLLGEPAPEVGRGVLARHDEQVMKCGYGTPELRIQALIQSVEKVDRERKRTPEQRARAVDGNQ